MAARQAWRRISEETARRAQSSSDRGDFSFPSLPAGECALTLT
jgi:hypothetical protein